MDAAIQLEQLWDEFARACNVDILLPVRDGTSWPDHDADIVQRISAVHSTVHGAWPGPVQPGLPFAAPPRRLVVPPRSREPSLNR